jgi:SulP family sulfate permease
MAGLWPGTVRAKWLPSVMIGTIAGIDNIGSGLAIASLLFAGPLVSGLGYGVGVVLLGSAVLACVVAVRSTLPNSIALIQETSIAILAGAIAVMAVRMTGPVEAKVATALATLGVATLTTGVLFWTVGRLRLGGLARFLPFPVVAGFLAGSGWLLVQGALAMITGETAVAPALARLSEPAMSWRAIAALAFALAMTLSLRRFVNPFTAPVILVGAALAFYAVIGAMGLGVEDARAAGHLPNLPAGAGVSLPTPDMLALVDWYEVLLAGPNIAAVAVLSIVGLLLTANGLELELGCDIDADAELRSSGVANLLSGSFGGPSGFVGLGITLLAQKMGAVDRKAGLATAAFMIVGFAFANPLVAHVPIFLTAGFVLFLGIELLERWLVATRRQLPLLEWLIVAGILAVVALVGFIEALAVGLMVSIMLFVYNYSKLPVVRLSASGVEQRSSVDRSSAAMKFLTLHGAVIEVVQLQGYLFFGTADRMVKHVRARLARVDVGPLRYLVLDFRHVSGVDSAAVSCFVKIRALVEMHGVIVFFTHVSADVLAALEKAGVTLCDDGPMRLDDDTDHALERCEEGLLEMHSHSDAEADLVKQFAAAIGPHERLADLVDAMSELHMQQGEVLIRAGDDAGDVYFIGTGRVCVQVALDNGRVMRLRTMTSGAVVGEIALYRGLKRTADVVVETPAVIYRLTAAKLAELEDGDPRLAILAHRLMASNLSEKLATATRMIRAGQR